MLNKEVRFFRPKKQVFLNKTLFGVKAKAINNYGVKKGV